MTQKSLERYHPPGGSLRPTETEENPEGGLNIQCLQSSEFVVGKQHNFNGPVTIINCTETTDLPTPDDNKRNEEKIIIRDKILTSEKNDENKKSAEGGPQGEKKWWKAMFGKLTKHSKVPLYVCIGVLLFIGIVLGVFFATVFETDETAAIGTHAFYSKKAWGGKPEKLSVEIKLPVPNMQEDHLGRDFADISYNFLVDSSGNIYEGRGWNKRNIMGGFVNGRSIDVALIGDYSQTTFPGEDLLDGLKQLLEFGVQNGKISADYSLLSANSTVSTLSPGKNVYAVIKNWPHFDPDPKSHVKEYDV